MFFAAIAERGCTLVEVSVSDGRWQHVQPTDTRRPVRTAELLPQRRHLLHAEETQN